MLEDNLKELISFMRFNTTQTFDAVTRECKVTKTLAIDVDSLLTALRKFKSSEVICLITICSLMDSDASSFPTRREIARVSGLSLATVQRHVKSLIDEGYLTRDFLESETESESLTIKEEANQNNESPWGRFKIAKDYVHYFAFKYKEKYGVEYLINYKRDTATVKRLMNTYSSDELIAIIDYTLEHYETKWRRFDYPYPTLGQLSSWLASVVATDIARETKKAQTIADSQATLLAEYQANDFSDF